jgi:hypothetical protein
MARSHLSINFSLRGNRGTEFSPLAALAHSAGDPAAPKAFRKAMTQSEAENVVRVDCKDYWMPANQTLKQVSPP